MSTDDPAETSPTLRVTVPALEARLSQPVRCLDHGFVRVVDYFGGDAAIVQAARVSYGAGTRKTSEDRQLVRYLMRHRHTTPFEMCEIKFHIKLPIFVARQWIRHRTANVNEISGRYSVFTDEFYLPEPHELAKQSTNNKQGRGDPLDDAQAERVRGTIERASRQAYADYEGLIEGEGAWAGSDASLVTSTAFTQPWLRPPPTGLRRPAARTVSADSGASECRRSAVMSWRRRNSGSEARKLTTTAKAIASRACVRRLSRRMGRTEPKSSRMGTMSLLSLHG